MKFGFFVDGSYEVVQGAIQRKDYGECTAVCKGTASASATEVKVPYSNFSDFLLYADWVDANNRAVKLPYAIVDVNFKVVAQGPYGESVKVFVPSPIADGSDHVVIPCGKGVILLQAGIGGTVLTIGI